jgi:hypothetical protein
MQDSSNSEPASASAREGGASESVGGLVGGGGGGGNIPSFERDPVTYLTLIVTAPRSSSSLSRDSLSKLAGSVAATVTAKGRSSAFSPANGGKGGGNSSFGSSSSSPYGLPSDVAYLYLQAAARHLPAAAEAASELSHGPSSSSSSSGMALFNPFEAFSRATARPSANNDPETDVPGGGGGDAKQPSWGGASYAKTGSSEGTNAILEVRTCRSRRRRSGRHDDPKTVCSFLSFLLSFGACSSPMLRT